MMKRGLNKIASSGSRFNVWEKKKKKKKKKDVWGWLLDNIRMIDNR